MVLTVTAEYSTVLSPQDSGRLIHPRLKPWCSVCDRIDIGYNEEMTLFKKFTDEKKLDKLFARYPIHKSNVFNEIAKALKFSNKQDYEQTAVTQIKKNNELSQKLKSRIPHLSEALKTKPVPPTVS